jgi:hypothetical protein
VHAGLEGLAGQKGRPVLGEVGIGVAFDALLGLAKGEAGHGGDASHDEQRPYVPHPAPVHAADSSEGSAPGIRPIAASLGTKWATRPLSPGEPRNSLWCFKLRQRIEIAPTPHSVPAKLG